MYCDQSDPCWIAPPIICRQRLVGLRRQVWVLGQDDLDRVTRYRARDEEVECDRHPRRNQVEGQAAKDERHALHLPFVTVVVARVGRRRPPDRQADQAGRGIRGRGRARDVTGVTEGAGDGSLTGLIPFLRVIVATCRRVTVPGGQPQLDLSTSSAGSSSILGRSDGSAIRSSSRSQARSPILRIGWCTVVSGGSVRLAGKMSSKPTIATSSRDPDAVRGERADHADGHLVVRADDRVGQRLARPAGAGEQPLRGLLAAVHGEPPVERAGQHRARVRVDDRLHGEPPGRGVRRGGRPVDVEQAAPAVDGDQVLHQRVRAGPVVRGYHVHAALRRVAGHHHHGNPLGQPGEDRRAGPRPRRSAGRPPCRTARSAGSAPGRPAAAWRRSARPRAGR